MKIVIKIDSVTKLIFYISIGLFGKNDIYYKAKGKLKDLINDEHIHLVVQYNILRTYKLNMDYISFNFNKYLTILFAFYQEIDSNIY